jgi:putative ABC transport system substrate-binding protein
MITGRKIFLFIVYALIVLCPSAEAQQPAKIPRVGYLDSGGSAPPHAFVQGLRDLGYIEGKTIAIEYRSAAGNSGRVPGLAAELVRLKVDIIVADGSRPSQAAKHATSTIPIVMTGSTDPVGTKLVASLARPGGNVTGLTSLSGELGGKLLELLKQIVPRLSRVAILRGESQANDLFVKQTETPARALGVKLIPMVVRAPEDFEGAFRAMTKERADAFINRLPAATYVDHFKELAELTLKHHRPAIGTDRQWSDAGGLISYGSDDNANHYRAATYIDKILKGAKPGELPVEAPTKFELVINLKTAKQIGLAIPPNVLARADRVIK